MQFNELLDHSETNPHALLRATGPRIRLSKDLEDVWQERRIDSLPVVSNRQNNLIILFFEPNDDAPTGGCDLHGVVEQVPDNLFEPHRISANKQQIIRRVNTDLDTLARRIHTHRLDRVFDRSHRGNSLAVTL